MFLISETNRVSRTERSVRDVEPRFLSLSLLSKLCLQIELHGIRDDSRGYYVHRKSFYLKKFEVERRRDDERE